MDPLSILGVAAAAVQFVDFGQRLLSETWHIYHSASGQTLRLQNLSAISADISKLSMTIRETFKVQQQDASALDSPDKELLHLCQECEDIATRILAVMPNISKKFETHLAADKEVVELAQQNGLRSYELKSVGECFRVALRSWWSRDEIAKLGERLEKVRQGMVTAATMSIWFGSQLRNSQSTKNWEHQLSSKLDTMIERLSQPLEVGPLQNEGYTNKIVDKAATESLRRNNVIRQIQDRLWRADWKPDTQLLSSFPKQTGLSVEEPNSFTSWLESNTGLPYWITGKPGSGKSTMMKFILQHSLLREHLHKWSKGTPQYTIKYYAWRPGAEMARSEDGVVAFQELNDVYHGSGEVILADIAARSKGVFLWTSLVTQTLLESLDEGSSLAHLQEILDAMPSEIEDLYDAIYAAIPKRLLPEVSVMLQLYVRAFQPVDWIGFALAGLCRPSTTTTAAATTTTAAVPEGTPINAVLSDGRVVNTYLIGPYLTDQGGTPATFALEPSTGRLTTMIGGIKNYLQTVIPLGPALSFQFDTYQNIVNNQYRFFVKCDVVLGFLSCESESGSTPIYWEIGSNNIFYGNENVSLVLLLPSSSFRRAGYSATWEEKLPGNP
ncbi:hypothetical protein FBULB1_276 [Fusarium bulbicola]|nr:hypothetical protein FBULB1_276 [Fusarium bulbicola]